MKKILEELYELEPTLREKENELEKVVTKIIIIKPSTNVPEDFKKKLMERFLNDENVLGKKQKIPLKNTYFRFVWFFLGIGIFTSFVISFGFINFLDKPININDIGLKSSKNTTFLTHNNESYENSPIPLSEKSIILDTNSGINHKLKNKNETIIPSEMVSKSIKSAVTINSGSNIQKENKLDKKDTYMIVSQDTRNQPALINITSLDHPIEPSLHLTGGLVAYVGEKMTIEIPTPSSPSDNTIANGTTLDNTQSRFLMNQNASSTSTTAKKNIGTNTKSISENSVISTFDEIIFLAQKKANLMIESKDIPFYVLKTPVITYTSQNNDSENNTVELVRTYLFPMERLDGIQSKVKEVIVMVR